MRGGTGDAEGWACRADVVAFLYFEGLLLMRSAANHKLQVHSGLRPNHVSTRRSGVLCSDLVRVYYTTVANNEVVFLQPTRNRANFCDTDTAVSGR